MFKFFLATFGVVALVIGTVFGWIGWTSRQQAQRASSLEQIDGQSLGALGLGTGAMAVGTLSNKSYILFRDLVLYTRSRFVGYSKTSDERRPLWETLDQRWPTLFLETEHGEVRVVGPYSVTFLGSDPIYITDEELSVGVTERYEGLRQGQIVTAVGHIEEDSNGRFLRADQVASGNADTFLSGERSSATFGLVAAGVLLPVGFLLLGLAVVL